MEKEVDEFRRKFGLDDLKAIEGPPPTQPNAELIHRLKDGELSADAAGEVVRLIARYKEWQQMNLRVTEERFQRMRVDSDHRETS